MPTRNFFLQGFSLHRLLFGALAVAALNIDCARAQSDVYEFSTFAGRSTYGMTDGTGAAARFNRPISLVSDPLGTVYVADKNNDRIRRITPAGVVSTFVGKTAAEPESIDGGPGVAQLLRPDAIGRDAQGNLYVVELANFRVRKITPDGTTTTLATASDFPAYASIVVSSNGTLFVSGEFSLVILRLTPGSTTFTQWAGRRGLQGTTDGTGTDARFMAPGRMVIDSNDTIYVADGKKIRRITPDAVVSTLEVPTTPELASITALALEPTGNLIVAGNYALFRVNPSGALAPVQIAGHPGATYNTALGFADGTGTAAGFSAVRGLSTDAAGNIYAADTDNNSIRKITPNGIVTTLAGLSAGAGAVDGVGTGARFTNPLSATLDSTGNLYVGESGDLVRKIAPDGTVTTPVGRSGPTAEVEFRPFTTGGLITGPDGSLYYTSTFRHVVVRLFPNGTPVTIAGTFNTAGYKNDTGTAALFRSPRGVALDAVGNLYVADSVNRVIRKITPAGVVSLFAGVLNGGADVDGAGSSASFINVTSLSMDPAGNLYSSGPGAKIRKITPEGVVSSIGGTSEGVMIDGPANVAKFFSPQGLAVDKLGNVFVADTFAVRKITPAGLVSTLGGSPTESGNADGRGAAARFNFTNYAGVTVDGAGNLLITDSGNHTVRQGRRVPTFKASLGNQGTSYGGYVTLTSPVDNPYGNAVSYQWRFNGAPISGATSSEFLIPFAQSSHVGIYTLDAMLNGFNVQSSAAALEMSLSGRSIGTADQVGFDIAHPNGNIFDQFLVTGSATSFNADPGQVTRASFVDLTDDIVQVEYSGPGVVTISLAGSSGPANATKYEQPSVRYMRGHATITVTGATENSFLSVFTVGTANAVNQALFKSGVNYDGVADIALINIVSPSGRFGGLRCANAEFSGSDGNIGVYAPGVRFTGPVNVHNVSASGTATPMLLTGTVDSPARIGITGGDMLQPNGKAIRLGSVNAVAMLAGTNSHGVNQPVQANKGVFERDGVDVTSQVIQTP